MVIENAIEYFEYSTALLEYINPHYLGLSLLYSKIYLLCFLVFPQFSAYYACCYAFQKCIMLLFCVCFSLCRVVLQQNVNGEVSLQLQHTNNSNSLKFDVFQSL